VNRRLTMPVPDEEFSTARADNGLLFSILLVLAFFVSILVIVLPGGAVGRDLRGILGQTFGWGSYLAPVILGAFTTGALRGRLDSSYQLPWSQAAGWLLEFWSVVTILQPFAGASSDPSVGGGLLGRTSWNALTSALGGPAATVLTLGLALIALALLLGLAFEDVATWTSASLQTIARVSLGLLRATLVGPRRKPPADQVGEVNTNRQTRLAGLFSPTGDTRIDAPIWRLPLVTILKSGRIGELSQADLTKKIQLIEKTLADFDVYAKVVQVSPGPAITQFGLEPGFRERTDRNGTVVRREKIRVSEIQTLSNDLALALAAPSIRIEAPVPGRQVVGLEVPNSQTTLVSLRDVVEGSAFQKLRLRTKLAVALGEDVTGQPVAADLAKMPHLLIAGATGSGKSICINSIISCLLLQATPDEVRLILIDPKRVELSTYNDVPHLLRPVVVDSEKVVGVLSWVVKEMDDRYRLFEKYGVRNLEGFNKIASARVSSKSPTEASTAEPTDEASALKPLACIVVVIDELADLMMLAPDETERLICRLAQLARATGIHLILATQRPSVDVITGLIKANFPTRISFAVTSQIDSRTILDMPGAEKLLGRGDMLYLPTDVAKPIRLQGTFVSDEEIEQLIGHWRAIGPTQYVEALMNLPRPGESPEEPIDELYPKAVELTKEVSRISISFLQRRLRIGHGRAANLYDLMEKNGILPIPESSGRTKDVLHDSPT
jgi:S-DNA-T family DNA segregation ATPase FtsK/SpoIIIE